MEILPAAVIPRREVVTLHAAPLATRSSPPAPVHPDEPPHRPRGSRGGHRPLHPGPPPPPHDRLEAVPRQARTARPCRPVARAARCVAGNRSWRPRSTWCSSSRPSGAPTVKRPQKNPRPRARARGRPRRSGPIWSRDQGKCRRPVDGGESAAPRSGSRWRRRAAGERQPSTVDNCRLTCGVHNDLAARQLLQRRLMNLFTGRAGKAEVPAWRAGRRCRARLRRRMRRRTACPPYATLRGFALAARWLADGFPVLRSR